MTHHLPRRISRLVAFGLVAAIAGFVPAPASAATQLNTLPSSPAVTITVDCTDGTVKIDSGSGPVDAGIAANAATGNVNFTVAPAAFARVLFSYQTGPTYTYCLGSLVVDPAAHGTLQSTSDWPSLGTSVINDLPNSGDPINANNKTVSFNGGNIGNVVTLDYFPANLAQTNHNEFTVKSQDGTKTRTFAVSVAAAAASTIQQIAEVKFTPSDIESTVTPTLTYAYKTTGGQTTGDLDSIALSPVHCWVQTVGGSKSFIPKQYFRSAPVNKPYWGVRGRSQDLLSIGGGPYGPATSGSYTVTDTYYEGINCWDLAANASYPSTTATYTVYPKGQAPAAAGSAVGAIAPTTLGTLTVGTAATPVTLTATGATAFAVTTGSLPAGLTLNATTGVISGTPTTAGAYSFTVTASATGLTSSTQQFAGTVGTGVGPITPTALGTLTVGAAATPVTLTATAATSFAVTTGTLPAGLSLNATTGAITGTPTTAGAYSFTVTASANGLTSSTQQYSGTVTSGVAAIAPTSLGSLVVGTAATATLTATGATSFAVTAGTLPAGLALNATTGVISGTPTTAGAYSFTVTASANGLTSSTQQYSGTISASGSSSTGTSGAGAVSSGTGAPIVNSTGGSGSATVQVTDPNGLATTATVASTSTGVTASIANGVVQITDPSFSGKVTVLVKVTNSSGAYTTLPVSIVVNPVAPTSVQSANATRRVPSATGGLFPVRSTISWSASPNATGYVVYVDDKRVASTTKTSVTVAKLLGPSNEVTVVPQGNDGTVGTAVPAAIDEAPVTIGNVTFASGSPTLSATAKKTLDKLVSIVRTSGFTAVSLAGYTDNVGSKASAVSLSAARSKAVRAYLQPKLSAIGVKIVAKSFADSGPIASNDTAAGRAANRRVDINVA